MFRRVFLLLICLILFSSFAGCYAEDGYTPSGEFYIKTSPSRGDAGVGYVISMESEFREYDAAGDVAVPMTVGFGHLPGQVGYGDDVQDTFYVRYRVLEDNWPDDLEPAWEKTVAYSDSWYDAKYDTTEQKNPPALIFARYGQFYPLYKEKVEILFPSELEKGYVEVRIFIVNGEEIMQSFGLLEFYFERKDGKLILDPNGD